jgi:hypothetical protein
MEGFHFIKSLELLDDVKEVISKVYIDIYMHEVTTWLINIFFTNKESVFTPSYNIKAIVCALKRDWNVPPYNVKGMNTRFGKLIQVHQDIFFNEPFLIIPQMVFLSVGYKDGFNVFVTSWDTRLHTNECEKLFTECGW